MSRLPIIGVTACTKQVGLHPNHIVGDKYVRAVVVGAGGLPLIIPALGELLDQDTLLASLDGLLFTGSPSNVEPHHYSGPASMPGTAHDSARDATTLPLIRKAIDAGIPVLGICRGFQEINVALGGTLRRDTSASGDLLPHHAPDGIDFDAMFDHCHRVELVEGGLLAAAYGDTALDVNSVHFQGIGRLAEGVTVEARAPDGLVEAYSARPNGAPLLAVQWHPEWQTDDNAQSQTYFRLLGRALRGEL